MAKSKTHLAQSEIIDQMPLACVDENAARALIERDRWGESPYCPHCGDTDVYRMTGAAATKRGLLRCHGCKKQFTVRVGSIFEDSKIPLRHWCRALWESASCKNGISALELSRKLQITYKSALFMMHRIRLAMAPGGPEPKLSGEVEMDETWVGGKPRYRGTPNSKRVNLATRWDRHIPVMAIVKRGGGVRTRVVPTVTAENIREALDEHVEGGATVYTDQYRGYVKGTRLHDVHKTVNHSIGEYVNRDNPSIHTNTVEGFFSRVKRGLNGTYHAVSKKHLHRYVSQFAFAYNTREMNDGERVSALIQGAAGKRLVYRTPRGAA